MNKIESVIQKEIITYLEGQGWMVIKVHNGIYRGAGGTYGGKKSLVGMPDLLVLPPPSPLKGLQATLAIEVKQEDGKIALAQINALKDLNARGVIAFVARSVDDVKNKIKDL